MQAKDACFTPSSSDLSENHARDDSETIMIIFINLLVFSLYWFHTIQVIFQFGVVVNTGLN